MKKCIATILAFIYLAGSTGATIHLHYCMGKFISSALSLTNVKKDKCTNCGMTKKKGCCEDEQKIIKIDKHYDFNVSTVSIPKFVAVVPYYNAVRFSLNAVSALGVAYPVTNSPPNTTQVPLYILNCIYRI